MCSKITPVGFAHFRGRDASGKQRKGSEFFDNGTQPRVVAMPEAYLSAVTTETLSRIFIISAELPSTKLVLRTPICHP